MQIHELTALARNSKASDIHISEGLPLMFRIDGHLQRAQLVGHLDRQTTLLAGDSKGDLGQLVQHMVRVDLTQRHPSFSRMGIKKPAGGITSSHEFRWYHITTVGCEIQ